jgi:hypothetical protein
MKRIINAVIHNNVLEHLEGPLDKVIMYLKEIPEVYEEYSDICIEIDYDTTDLQLKGKR